MTKAFEQGFKDYITKVAQAASDFEVPDPKDSEDLSDWRNSFRDIGQYPLADGMWGLLGLGPLLEYGPDDPGAVGFAKAVTDIPEEAVNNNTSGVPDYGPTLSFLHNAGRMAKDHNNIPEDINPEEFSRFMDVTSPENTPEFNEEAFKAVSPERYAKMTGAGTGPTPEQQALMQQEAQRRAQRMHELRHSGGSPKPPVNPIVNNGNVDPSVVSRINAPYVSKRETPRFSGLKRFYNNARKQFFGRGQQPKVQPPT